MTDIEQVNSGVRYENTNNTALVDLQQNEDDWEGGNNSAKLFERSRIKALAGQYKFYGLGLISLICNVCIVAVIKITNCCQVCIFGLVKSYDKMVCFGSMICGALKVWNSIFGSEICFMLKNCFWTRYPSALLLGGKSWISGSYYYVGWVASWDYCAE